MSARVERIIPETPGVTTCLLRIVDSESAANYSYLPGQFNMLYLPGAGEAAISISGDPEHPDLIPHTVRDAGNVTHALAECREGAVIGLRGPYGSCWPVERLRTSDVILVAGGIGLAPLRPVIFHLLNHVVPERRVTLLIGARNPSGLLYREQYAVWAESEMDVQVTVDRPDSEWQSDIGVVTALLNRLPLRNPQNTVLMTCGPEVMMYYTAQAATERGLRGDSIYLSLERNMNCAFGLCGHCQLGPEFVCRDGPVFTWDRIGRFLKVEDL